MKKLLLFISFIICTFATIGQEKKVFLQIDTLILNGFDNFSITITGQGFLNFGEEIDDSCFIINNDKYPNFICPIFLKTDSSNIKISLDNKGGYLIVLDPFKTKKDTIRINKLIVFNNCYTDTTFTRIDYCLKNDDGTLNEPYKTKYSKTTSKNRCYSIPLLKTSYIVNDELYLVSFQKKKSDETKVTNFQGYKPKKYSKKPDKYKGKVIYCQGQSVKTNYINVITLNLKH